MKISLRYASLSVLLFLLMQFQTSCSPRISGEGGLVPPAIELSAKEGSQKYNIQLDFMKHHFSGMLIVRRMPDNEIRILASTYFGLSLFDFSLCGDQFKVNSCVAPMQKENVLKLLEMDFKQLFLKGKGVRVRTTKDRSTGKSTNCPTGKSANHSTDKRTKRSIEKRTSGKGFGKSIIFINGETPGDPEKVKIKHPWIRLTIQLDKLENRDNRDNRDELN